VEDFLAQLNKSQRDAVTYTDGASLVVAGAGSGKTRVLTYKIAYLLLQGVSPFAILSLTFTNKAAREMKLRIAAVVGDEVARRLWMGTFHSIFSRILRTESQYIGYPSSFTIYDSSDSKSLLKSIMKEMQLDDKTYRLNMVQGRISNAKNALVTPESYRSNKDLISGDNSAKVPLIHEIYTRYQNRCKQAGAMDFDDLLLQTNILFRDHPAVLEKYRGHFQYILVDEYQDTNFAQHLIVQRLSEVHQRICVVGDDAQSIYSFRGANIDNILKFKQIYQNCQVFKLEQNYRSTQTIVNAANSLIDKNTEQIQKTVFSENAVGEKIKVTASFSDYEEGYAVASGILELQRDKEYDFSHFAILYRTNAQSRILEEALRKRNIPYRIYGGLSFYQRKEIKDVLAYFRMIANPHDEEALKRIINYPTRGIGDTTMKKVFATASEHQTSPWNVVSNPQTYSLAINNGTQNKLIAFAALIESFTAVADQLNVSDLATLVVKQSGLSSLLYQDLSVEGISRQENLQELLKGISEFCDIKREEGDEETYIGDFLAEISLMSDQDTNTDENRDQVTMMTVHAAKGLEFKNVFVVGLEEELFPSSMNKDSYKAIEEERRLFYVAITRAEEHCILTYAENRYLHGKSNFCTPSRFLKDIDPSYLQISEGRGSSFASDRNAYNAPLKQPHQAFRQPAVELVGDKTSSIEHLKAIPINSASSIPIDFANGLTTGIRIRHDRFGDGEVLSLECSSSDKNDIKVKVLFNHFGEKQLLLKYAKFTIVE
jgi:DNA helicase-2/ATP-dependent DNA helicase PcrA